MNELVIRLFKKFIQYLEQSSLDKKIDIQDWSWIKRNSVFTRIILLSIITGVFGSISWGALKGFLELDIFKETGFYLIVAILFLIVQLVLFVYSIWRIKKNDINLISYFYLVYLPSFALLWFAIRDFIPWILIWLVSIYSIVYILKSVFVRLDTKWMNTIKNWFLMYNLGFFVVLALNVALISIGWNLDFIPPLTDIIFDFISDIPSYSIPFLEWIFVLLILFFFLTSGIFALNIYFQEAWKSKKTLHIGIIMILIVYVIQYVPGYIDRFYSDQIQRANKILSIGWQNEDSYTDARVLLLDRAFLSKIKNYKSIDRNLFSKLYDSTPEEYFGEKIAEYTDSWRSFATNASKIGEKANVQLSLAEIENRVSTGSKFPILETIYRFHLVNTSEINQEVIVNFETPTKYSVVSGLRLGLDLQMTGQIAPRWAATKVYQDSMRRNIDPALLEKVGRNTYSLRVFPVPSKRDQKSQWRQLVEVKMLTPILSKTEKITYAPKFSFINLKFDENSGIKVKVYDESKLTKEDVIQNRDIEKYLTSEHTLDLDPGTEFNIWEFCVNKDIFDSWYNWDSFIWSGAQSHDKISLFFDNSLSVGRNGANSYFYEIYSKIKNFWNSLHDIDLYSYNFDVNKILVPNDIKFWGYSDIDRVIDYIIKNNITNQRIILITDDDSFNLSTLENKTLDLGLLVTNQISIIKVGNGIKTYKQEVNNILAATNGNIYEINSSADIDTVIDKIFDIKNTDISFVSICTSTDSDQIYNKIQAGYVWNYFLSNIHNQWDWESIARLQTAIAKQYMIVNQFNSFIALETIQQQRDLDEYSHSSGKYDAEYNNNIGWMANSSLRVIRTPRVNIQWTSSSVLNISPERYSTTAYGLDRVAVKGSNFKGSSFEGKMEFNFFGLLMFLIYVVEFYSLLAFLLSYIKSYKE